MYCCRVSLSPFSGLQGGVVVVWGFLVRVPFDALCVGFARGGLGRFVQCVVVVGAFVQVVAQRTAGRVVLFVIVMQLSVFGILFAVAYFVFLGLLMH